MRSMWRVGAASVAIVLATSGVAAATVLQLGIRDQDRLRDGSCQTAAVQLKQQDQDRDRLKDGTCEVASIRLRGRDRTRLRDGTSTTPARERERERQRVGRSG